MSLDVMKQALAALEGWANHGEWVWPESALEQAKRNTTESITALRAAIEQAQDPVAHTLNCVCGAVWDVSPDGVEEMVHAPTPPPRQWQGLTADEIWQCNAAPPGSAVEYHICMAHQNVLDFAEAIETKLKEKNG